MPRKIVLQLLLCSLLLLLAPAASYASAYGQLESIAGPAPEPPPVPEPSCAECGGRNGNHSRNCPYYGGGSSDGDSGSSSPVDVTRAPIFVAPVGMIGGVFMGAGWYFEEMAGHFPKKGFLSSYSEYVSIKDEDDVRRKSFNFGSHLGALPWLALYAPTWPIRQGVVSLANGISEATTPRYEPPNPQIAVYNAIVSNYASLCQITAGELLKTTGDIKNAEMRRNLFLDEFIYSRSELRTILQEKGIEEARARATKQLDAWSKSRAERQKIAAVVSQSIQEKEALCRDALEKASANSFFADFQLDKTDKGLEALLKDPTLSPEIRNSLIREQTITKRLGKAKGIFDIASNVEEIREAIAKSKGEGKDLAQWLEEPEASELIMRLNLKLLTTTAKAEPFALAAGGGETAIDVSYGILANVRYARQIEEERDLLLKLKSVRLFQDLQANDWDRVNSRLSAAQEQGKIIHQRLDQYEKMQKENESYAQRLRK